MALRREKKLELNGDMLDVRTEIYTSALQVVEDCRHREVRFNDYDMAKASIKKNWQGVDSYDEALELLSSGYQPVTEELKEELSVAPTTGPRIAFKNERQGFAPVVPLAIKGVPENMINMHMKPIKAKVIDVYYDMTANAGRTPQEFIKAGKLLLGTIITLEKQGYKFNLYALQDYYGTSDGKKAVDFLCVKIKSSDRPIDLKRMSFPLTHPAFFRVIGFDWQGKSPITRYLGWGRGSALSSHYDDRDITKMIRTLYGDNAFYIACTTLITERYNKDKVKEALTNDKLAG